MPTLVTGAAFGQYTLQKRLATGGMGEIWLAEQKGISGFTKQVVIKTILEAFSDDPSLVEMFLEEGRVAAGLTHPNIAQTYDLGQFEDTYYIAMEYVHGRDLRDLLLANIDRGRLIPLNLVLRIVAEVCQGLHYAHTWKTPGGQPASIIHRDISPQNILVTFDGVVKIVDFGIAKAAHRASKTRSGVLKGKYAYMAPEQIRGKNIDGRSDLFSLGVVMYELVTARRLFKRDSEVATLDAVLEAYVPPPTRLDQSVPRPVEELLLMAVQRDAADRFSDAREMQLAIEAVMLSCALPASSAHLSAYMHEMFGEQGTAERKGGSLNSRMESLPGVKEKAEPLERTAPFTPGMVLPQQPRTESPTRNLMLPKPPVSEAVEFGDKTPVELQPVPPRHWGRVIGILGLTAVVIGVGIWLLLGQPNENQPEAVDHAGEVAEPIPAREPPAGPPDAGPVSTDPGAGKVAGGDGGSSIDYPILVASPVDAGNSPPPKPDEDNEGEPGKVVASNQSRSFLSVTTDPPADIFLGNRKLGKGAIHRVAVPSGKQLLKVVAAPGATRSIPLVLAPGEHQSRHVAFQQGTIRVVVQPWADVWVDGNRIGQTPIPPIHLLEGVHEVLLKNSELSKEVRRSVKVRPGEEAAVNLDWR